MSPAPEKTEFGVYPNQKDSTVVLAIKVDDDEAQFQLTLPIARKLAKVIRRVAKEVQSGQGR